MIAFEDVKLRSKKKNDANFKKLFFFASKFSVYFSWIFINLGLSANQVTGVFFATGLLSCICFFVFDPLYVFFGVALWRLHIIFDLCDGEVARFNQSFSINGAYWDYMIHALLFPLCFFAMSFALSEKFSDENFLIMGAVGMLSLSLMLAVKNNYYRAMLFSNVEWNPSDSARSTSSNGYSFKDYVLYATSFDALTVLYFLFCLLDFGKAAFFMLLIAYIFFFLALGFAKFILFSVDGLYQRRS